MTQKLEHKIETDDGYIVSVANIEATVLRPYVSSRNGNDPYYCFVVDVVDESEAHGSMRLWCSDELDIEMVKRLTVDSQILFSAERDDDGDMIITKLKVLS